MKLSFGRQIEISEIEGKHLDLVIAAFNHEARKLTAFNFLNRTASVSRLLTFCYNAEQFSKAKGRNPVIIDNHTKIFDLLDAEFAKIENDSPNIFVDYSCMTKSWYYSIILYLSNKRLSFKNISTYFSYTPSKFSTPQLPKPNSEIAPLPGKYIVPTDKPKALIVGLGYEQNKAEGIIEHLGPKVSYIFYTKPTLDSRFVKVIEENNQSILLESKSRIITYPSENLLFLERELTALYYKLRDEYSIIIAPLGPKPFAFVSMLMSVKFNEIDIWRVGSGSDINEYTRQPLGDKRFIVSEVVWMA